VVRMGAFAWRDQRKPRGNPCPDRSSNHLWQKFN